MPDHERIWLQPECCVDPGEGRQWCQDKVWPEGADCDAEPTEYVRTDLAKIEIELRCMNKDCREIRAENERLRAALAIYADPHNWTTDGIFLPDAPDDPYRGDCGARAQAALQDIGAPKTRGM